MEEEERNEKDLSTKEKDQKDGAWISETDEYAIGQERNQTQKSQRQEEIIGLRRKAGRLKSRRDFENVFARGRKIITSKFALHFLPNNDNDIKIGICVGKSLAKAVKRNRLKRQIREIIRNVEFKRKGLNIILVARRDVIGKDFDYLKTGINEILTEARLI